MMKSDVACTGLAHSTTIGWPDEARLTSSQGLRAALATSAIITMHTSMHEKPMLNGVCDDDREEKGKGSYGDGYSGRIS